MTAFCLALQLQSCLRLFAMQSYHTRAVSGRNIIGSQILGNCFLATEYHAF
jgi:hypothetical protein